MTDNLETELICCFSRAHCVETIGSSAVSPAPILKCPELPRLPLFGTTFAASRLCKMPGPDALRSALAAVVCPRVSDVSSDADAELCALRVRGDAPSAKTFGLGNNERP